MTRVEDFGPLPEWDLADLYSAPDAPEIERDLERIVDSARSFEDRLKGRLEDLSGDELAEAVSQYEAIEEGMGRLASYAGLLYATRTNDSDVGRFYQGIQEKLNGIGTHLLFFTLELNRLPEKALAEKFESERLKRF
ncbi:MAG: oligoendopeptidase F, partial [Alphaproteobacteria bacterium]|nr:oligoendopeptidase F [Alphaproteobacteria bacterium]